eukprot:CAMPEP_0119542524 /NCGR_PEP_ID=MMETSP1344-20130328/53634_1 /TAXON_ID=236787 /ORGANISM="Florenciella parvula, Strain CCMP2471" /LENGTH=51 /DNA_ID=CAMNT_0007586753 /DNA_START=46 /DNA_END=198 /DNA_ORIENTATION=+
MATTSPHNRSGFSLWYLRWELWTGIYMMDWWEKYFCNTVAVTAWAGMAYYG